MKRFNRPQEAFEYYFDKILSEGTHRLNTKTLFNEGFYIDHPWMNIIFTPWRKWNLNYAKFEWNWYLSGNRNADEIGARASIWKSMQDENGNVNSNYGWQWKRNDQLKKIINILKDDPLSRKAVISIYDGKEINDYSKDTPCTQGIHFQVIDNKLCMSVTMRSNDLVYGFCNDQYCFSELQAMVATTLELEIGWYYHFVSNLHIYERHYDLKSKYYE